MSEEVKAEKQETGLATKQASVGMGKFGVELQSMDDLWRFAKLVAASGLAPKGMESPEKIAIAVQAGMEIGLKPMQALQSMAVVNGRPAVWGDAVLGLCLGTGQVEQYRPEEIGEKGKDSYGFKVTIKRRGFDPVENSFTIEDAKRAGLWGKAGPWTQYPTRMLLNRPRSFSLRDTFADVLKGCPLAEEAQDMPKEIPVTIHEPDGTETKVKAKGMKAVKEKLAATTVEATATTVPSACDSTGLSDAEKAEIAASETSGELPLK